VEKLNHSRNRIDVLMKALPVEWVKREIYEDNMQKALEVLSDEANASLLAYGAVMRCEAITGDRKVLLGRFK